MAGCCAVDWAQQTAVLMPGGLYTKSAFWLRSGGGEGALLTPHLELELLASADGSWPTLVYFSMSPRVNLVRAGWVLSHDMLVASCVHAT
jgi:hypothetical protein